MSLLNKELPILITFEKGFELTDFVEWYNLEKGNLDNLLLEAGAVLIRGINIDSIQKFDSAATVLFPNSENFLDGNSSRGKHTSKVYNASEYDNNEIIRLHTEFSYSNLWPAKLCFCCITPAVKGGETILGNCEEVLNLLDKQIVDEFEKKGITYIRNLHGGGGLGPSWHEAFESNDKKYVEQYCKANNISVIWEEDSVRVIQTRPAIRLHPVKKCRLWFNQVDQFYPLLYGETLFNELLSLYDDDVERLPMIAKYGDGTEIQKEYIEEIVSVLDGASKVVGLRQGDLLIVDNMLALHGRLPFTGDRKILVAMS